MPTFKQYLNMLTKKGKYVTRKTLFTTLSLIFVKVRQKKVNVYIMTYWGMEEDPIATLYTDHVTLHKCPYYYDPFYWKISSFIKIKFKVINGLQFVIFSNKKKFIFFKGMKIKYNGNPCLPFPQKHENATRSFLDIQKERRNVYMRSYYHQKQAEKRFEDVAIYEITPTGRKRLINVNVSTLPMDDVFKLQNVSQRQYLIDYYGLNTILASLETEVLDKDVINGNPYELVTVKIPFTQSSVKEDEIGTYLRMVNPSTDEIHFEGVPNYDRELARSREEWDRDETILKPTVKAALAWRDGETRYMVPTRLT